MKLYLTLEDNYGYKIERVILAEVTFGDAINDIVDDMITSLEQSKKPL